MEKSYEYIISLQDKMSGTMNKIVGTSSTVVDKLEGMNKIQKALRDTNKDLGGSIFALKQKIDLLQAEKELIPASHIGTIKQYNSEIKSLSGEIGKLENATSGGQVKRWFSDLTSSVPALNMLKNPLVIIGAGILKLRQIVSGGEVAWNEEREAQVKLAAIMRNTMDATDGEVSSIMKLAEAQEKLGVIEADRQIAGSQELATYLSRKDSLEKLIPVMNDMLAQQYGMNATQEQAVGIASMMGKVMDGQVGALSRYGYKFTEAQEKILKYGKEPERAATLADVISESVGGVNAALAATPEGKWRQHEMEMGGIQAKIGSLIVLFRDAMFPVFEQGALLLSEVVDWLGRNGTTIAAVIGKIAAVVSRTLKVVFGIVSGIVDMFVWWWDAIEQGNPLIIGLTATIGAFTLALNAATIAAKAKALMDKILTKGTDFLTKAQAKLNAVFLMSPLGWIALAIGAVVTAVVVCWNKFEGFRQVVFGVWNLVKEFGKTLYNAVLEPIKKIIAGLGSMGKAILHLFKGNFSAAADAAKEGMTDLAKGMVGIAPVTIATNVVQNGEWSEAWEKGKQQGTDSWTKSQQEKDNSTPGAAFQIPKVPRILDDPLGSGDTSKGNKKVFKLNELADNKLASSTYSSIVAKLNPVKLASLSAKAAAAVAIPAMLTATSPVQARVPVAEPDLNKTEYVDNRADIMDVRIVSIMDAAGKKFPRVPVMDMPKTQVPVVNSTPELSVQPTPVSNILTAPEVPAIQIPETPVSIPEPVANFSVPSIPVVNNLTVPQLPAIQVPEVIHRINIPVPETPEVKIPVSTQLPEMTEMPEVYTAESVSSEVRQDKVPTKSVHIDRVCDNVTIHIAHADGKGYEQIEEEIQDLFIKVLDYEA